MPPAPLACPHVIAVEVPTYSVLATPDTDHRYVPDHERRRGGAEALGMVVDRRLPDDLTGLAVQRDHLRVERRHQDQVAGNRHAPIGRTAADAQVISRLRADVR